MLDLDNNPATGGAPAALGIPTSFSGADLVARVVVRRGPIIPFAPGLLQQPLPLDLQAEPTIWRFEGGAFVPVFDPGIRAFVEGTRYIADLRVRGSEESIPRDVVSVVIPNAVRGPRAESHRIDGQAGQDNVSGGEGHDQVRGGDGKDVVSGGPGNDQLFGEAGDDVLQGGPGDDLLDGGPGRDRCQGAPGRDTLRSCE